MSQILCLDLGTKTGWCVIIDGRITESGVYDFSPDPRTDMNRFVDFYYSLSGLVSDCGGFDRVYFEDVVAHKGVKAAHIYGGFKAIMEFHFWDLAEICGVPVGTIKKSFTGNGRASKHLMIDEAINRGHKPKDDNEADAIALAYYVIENKDTK